MKDIVVLILAGGDSGRFWPIADKHSLSFAGKPLILHSLSQLRKFGFKNIVIVANKQNQSLFHNLKNELLDMSIGLVEQSDPRGMAGAIVSANDYIKGKKLLVVSASDIFEDLLLSSFKRELATDPQGLITGIKQDVYFPGGYLKVSNGKVLEIIEKPDPDKIPSNIVTIVLDYFKNADNLLSAISRVKTSADDVFEKALDLLIAEGTEFRLLPYSGFWGYLKYPWHTLNIMAYFLHKIEGKKIKNASIHKSALIMGNVFIEDGAKILENTKIVGPTYIGSGTIIGQNSLVRESMIGANCVVGYATEIARSFIGGSCWFHTNYVGDSVISDNVSMGAGAVLANFKLDEGAVRSVIEGKKIDTGKVKLGAIIGANVRIGVNSSVMPGIKIGENSFLGSGVVLDKDLSNDKYCCLIKSAYTVRNNLIDITSKSRQEQRKKLKIG